MSTEVAAREERSSWFQRVWCWRWALQKGARAGGLSPASAEVVAASTCRVVWQKLPAFLARLADLGEAVSPARLGGWVRGILLRKVLERRREWHRRPGLLEWDCPATAPQPLDALVAEEEKGRLLAEVDKLPSGDREVIGLFFKEQLSPGEIEERLGITREAVYAAKHRALTRLRARLKRAEGPQAGDVERMR